MSEQNLYLEPGEGDLPDAPSYPLDPLPCTVGRSPKCALQLEFDRISREHCRFEYDGREVTVTDLDSTNGTFVNHQRIDAPTPIRNGDIIHLGNHPFVVRQRQTSGETRPHAPLSQRQSSNDTIIGFTALPTGFPVQAPEFFEMLNDEQLTGMAEPIMSSGGTPMALSLRGRSAHPRLAADSNTLFRLAEDLGEEVRLAQMVRRICLEQADQAGLQSTLLLQVHPAECEELDLLVDEWLDLAGRYRHLALACELPLKAFQNPSDVGDIRRHLNARDIEVCGVALGLDAGQLAAFNGQLDYLRVSALQGPERIPALTEAIGPFVRILVEQVNEAELIKAFSDAGASLFQGPAIGKAEPIQS
ncbi:FHA domain-containing protein [Wenzhouxiangella marina]|uniref:Uncharacterized protein n=1 Tax=Wenzhouxiangella marina TaxID=1579979 RepID=A0A0K0XWV9_9GAMM|nr:FHA domain-containing protein [Wenzhouxiangella marina]AKS42155.1 hypothetical protein WM2015_1788 [Wenzhouxiangella marina]MBB6086073.1 hypothetical protein [Wenzhouxiangella marina]